MEHGARSMELFVQKLSFLQRYTISYKLSAQSLDHCNLSPMRHANKLITNTSELSNYKI